MTEYETNLLALLGEIARSLDAIAQNTQRERPDEPNLQRPIEQFARFAWESIEATVVRSDDYGAAIVEWDGRLWTRRSPENKFGEAIWFSRAAGKDADGNNHYLRLITFRKVTDAEPLSRAAERAVRSATMPVTPLTSAVAPRAAAEPPTEADHEFAALPSASAQAHIPAPKAPPAGPQISAGARTAGAPIVEPTGAAHAARLIAGKTTGSFRNWAADFARRYPHYRINPRSEDADMYHILRTVGSFGIAQIDADNLAIVCERLEQHASAAA